MYAPIVLFVYNRPQHVLQTLEALARNPEAAASELFIFCDGPKAGATETDLEKITQTRAILRSKQWCGKVHITEAAENRGLANSVIAGVTKIVNEYGKVIVLEDDIITTPFFLSYMNKALDLYENNDLVMHVSGFSFPINNISHTNSSYFINMVSSWSWGTWKRAWNYFDPLSTGYEELKTNKKLANEFDLNGSFPYTEMILHQMEDKNIDSWAIRWWWSVFKRQGMSLMPDKSLIRNIGYGVDSTHLKEENRHALDEFDQSYFIKNFPDKAVVDSFFTQKTSAYLLSKQNESFEKKSTKSGIVSRVINKLFKK